MMRDIFQSRCSHCGGSHTNEKCFKKHRKEKGYKKPSFNLCNPNNKHNERNGQKPNTCIRCVSEDHFIANFPKLETSDKKVHRIQKSLKLVITDKKLIDNTPENSAYECESQNIYASMAHIYSNAENPRRNYGDSLQPNNCILDSGATCNTTPEISDFIPGLLAEKDKYIKVAYGNFITAKKTGKVQITMRDDNGNPFITTLYNILLA